jgi:hypothetical protein
LQELTNQQKYGIAPTMSSQALMQSTATGISSTLLQSTPASQPPPPPPPVMNDPQQVLARILGMTEDEINLLPEQNREQIRLIVSLFQSYIINFSHHIFRESNILEGKPINSYLSKFRINDSFHIIHRTVLGLMVVFGQN